MRFVSGNGFLAGTSPQSPHVVVLACAGSAAESCLSLVGGQQGHRQHSLRDRRPARNRWAGFLPHPFLPQRRAGHRESLAPDQVAHRRSQAGARHPRHRQEHAAEPAGALRKTASSPSRPNCSRNIIRRCCSCSRFRASAQRPSRSSGAPTKSATLMASRNSPVKARSANSPAWARSTKPSC